MGEVISIEKHKEFLLDNLEDQNNYSTRFSQIFEEMDIFCLFSSSSSSSIMCCGM